MRRLSGRSHEQAQVVGAQAQPEALGLLHALEGQKRGDVDPEGLWQAAREGPKDEDRAHAALAALDVEVARVERDGGRHALERLEQQRHVREPAVLLGIVAGHVLQRSLSHSNHNKIINNNRQRTA